MLLSGDAQTKSIEDNPEVYLSEDDKSYLVKAYPDEAQRKEAAVRLAKTRSLEEVG